MRRAIPVLVVALAVPPAAAQDAPPTAAQLKVSANNLKQIGLTFHDYESVYGYFPNNVYKDGKALLSWRVMILPYLGENPLFNQFNRDEPWDSEANKNLIEKMPKVYAPTWGKAKAGETVYRGFVTARGPFGPKMGSGARIARFRDGLSNTGLVFEAAEPVAWTKPDDLELPAKGPLPKLGGPSQVLLGDGSVRRLGATPDPDELRKLIDPADGHAVDFDKLRGK